VSVSAIIVVGSNNTLRDNLMSLTVFPPTYQDRYEENTLNVMATVEIHGATGTKLVGNVVAGSERSAYRLNGESCTEGEPTWANNTGHSTLLGLTMWQDDCLQTEECSRFNGFYIYKSFSYGFYSNGICSIVIENSKFVDNSISIFPYIMRPDARTHGFSRKFVKIHKSLFVGASDTYDCKTDIMSLNDHPNIKISVNLRSWAFKRVAGRIALGWPMFACENNLAPKHPLNDPHTPSALYGNIVFEGMVCLQNIPIWRYPFWQSQLFCHL